MCVCVCVCLAFLESILTIALDILIGFGLVLFVVKTKSGVC